MHSHKPKQGEKVHYVASTTFTLERNYDDLKAIGKGSYGVVCSAYSSSLGEKVAIKKITPVSKQIHDAKHVLREIKLMRHMGKHENIITLYDLYLRETSDELYIVMELLDSDLHRILQSKQPLTENHYRHFFHQLLCGVKYLHDNRIIHRDLKPGNLLVSRDCRLRITDFGLARERPMGKGEDIDDEVAVAMTEHVVTRWYRPPELMLNPDGLYDYSVDMWSCGCILAEMLGRAPLFPGKNFVHQLTLVFDVIGCPPPRETQHVTSYEAVKFLQTQGNKRHTPFRDIYPAMSSDATDMLEELLVFSPVKRATVDYALGMAFMQGVGYPASTEYPPTSPDFEFSFERTEATKYQLRQAIAAEVASFKKELRHRRVSGGVPAEAGRPSTAVRNGSAAGVDSQQREQQQQHSEVFSKENSSTSTKGDARKEPVPVPAAAPADKARSASAPRLRGANGSTTATANSHNMPDASAGAANADSRRRISMKPPVFYQQHTKKTTTGTAATAAASTMDNRLSSTQGIAHHHHSDGEEDENDDESDSDAYDKLFQTKSTVTPAGGTKTVGPVNSNSKVPSAPPSSSVSAVMERIARIVESSTASETPTASSHFTSSSAHSVPTPSSSTFSSSAGPKSPAKTLRYHPPADMPSVPERPATGYEYKSMDLEDVLRPARASAGAGGTAVLSGAGSAGLLGMAASSSHSSAAYDTPASGSAPTVSRFSAAVSTTGAAAPSVISGGAAAFTSAASAASPGRRSLAETYLSPRRIIPKDHTASGGSSRSGLRAFSGDDHDDRHSSSAVAAAPTAAATVVGGGGGGGVYDSMLGRFEDKFNLSHRLHQVDQELAASAAGGVGRFAEKPRAGASIAAVASTASQLKSSVLPSPPKHQTVSTSSSGQGRPGRLMNDMRRSEAKHADSDNEEEKQQQQQLEEEERGRKGRDESSDEGDDDIVAARRLLREYAEPLRQRQQQQERLSAAQVAAELLRERDHHSRKEHSHLAHTYHVADNRRVVDDDEDDDGEGDEEEHHQQAGRHQKDHNKKKYTVAKSPKFSTMSWQRRDSSGAPAAAAAATVGADKKRATSTLRNAPSAANLDEYESTTKGAAAAAAAPPPAPKKVPSYAQPTASQALKMNNPVRSESAHRARK